MKLKVGRRSALITVLTVLLPAAAVAQQMDPQGFLRDYSKGPKLFPSLFSPYQVHPVPQPVLENTPRLHDLIHNGQLQLSLSDALALALENNLSVEAERYVVPLATASILQAEAGQGLLGTGGTGTTGGGRTVSPAGAFDPNVSLSFSWDRAASPLNNVVVSGTPFSVSYAAVVSANYNQLFQTGTNYTFSVTGNRASTNNIHLYNPDVSTNFSLGISQPLLNGFGKLPYIRNILIAKNNNAISQEAFRLQVISTVVTLEDSYWNLAAAAESVQVAQQALVADQTLLENNKRQLEVGTLAQLDVVTAESEVASGERDLVVAQENLQIAETTLKYTLAKRVDAELDAAHVVITDQMPEPRDTDVPNLQDALANATRNRPEIRQAQGNLQNQGITEQYTARNLLPNGSVFGYMAGSGLQGDKLVAGTVQPGGLGDSLSQAFALDYPEYAGGVLLGVPIRNRAAQANNLTAQLTDRQLEVTLQNTSNQAELGVRQAIIGLVQGKAQVQSAHEAVLLETQALDAEQKKLQAGVSTPYNVILIQRDLTTAQQSEVQAMVTYANALVAMDQSMGTTLDRNGIEFSEALAGTVTKMPTPPFSVVGFPPAGQGSR